MKQQTYSDASSPARCRHLFAVPRQLNAKSQEYHLMHQTERDPVFESRCCQASTSQRVTPSSGAAAVSLNYLTSRQRGKHVPLRDIA
ncbi:hypothetical protein EYF80_058429 [Liparis tanakae]|uniref:Uncharacterized protein n=1 Tax=Liparis tanakae TaxID=230148 RepID=A0A4Z2ERK5_9TELE|nr:hypothetical protein EYF80_058429 [Liparis tanakae]